MGQMVRGGEGEVAGWETVCSNDCGTIIWAGVQEVMVGSSWEVREDEESVGRGTCKMRLQ